jgi:hypothetical protein
MKILKSIHNSSDMKMFLIPKDNSTNCQDWVEISIDYLNNVFTAKKVLGPSLNDEWEENNDYTFPSSLLNEFLHSTKNG